MKLYEFPAYKLSKMLRNKEISSRELTEAVFVRADEVDQKVEAYLSRDREAALKMADAADGWKAISGKSL